MYKNKEEVWDTLEKIYRSTTYVLNFLNEKGHTIIKMIITTKGHHSLEIYMNGHYYNISTKNSSKLFNILENT